MAASFTMTVGSIQLKCTDKKQAMFVSFIQGDCPKKSEAPAAIHPSEDQPTLEVEALKSQETDKT